MPPEPTTRRFLHSGAAALALGAMLWMGCAAPGELPQVGQSAQYKSNVGAAEALPLPMPLAQRPASSEIRTVGTKEVRVWAQQVQPTLAPPPMPEPKRKSIEPLPSPDSPGTTATPRDSASRPEPLPAINGKNGCGSCRTCGRPRSVCGGIKDCMYAHGLLPCAEPAPLGTYIGAWSAAQAEQADATDFVIFQREWYQGGNQLGPEGHRHLQGILSQVAKVPYPVLIEPVTPILGARSDLQKTLAAAAELDQVRRQLIVDRLLACGIDDAHQRVLIAYPDALQMLGPEAARTYQIYIRAGQSGGGVGGGGFGGGGFGGGGFGGGGFGGGGFGGGGFGGGGFY